MTNAINTFFGKTAIVPLFNIPVPIVPSEHAEKDKGTGIMMVCTFGDAADVAWWKKSGLPIKQIIGMDGKILNITYGEGVFTTLNKEEAQKNFNQIIGLPAHVAKKKSGRNAQRTRLLNRRAEKDCPSG